MRLLSIDGNGVTTALQFLAIFLLTQIGMATKTPQPPKLSFLYTAYVECEPNLMSTFAGPHGIRESIPIVGGNFSGPHLSGKILNVGADWGLVDPRTSIFSADTRYNLRTDDGADIYIQTSGPQSPDGHLHLRLVFETGSPKYYWLNNIVAIGILTGLPSTGNLSLLRIDAWNFASDWNATQFVNSTTAA
ncbi:Scytalone dehydratase [Penicillium brasilianum]|uniref:Scytalone dehydratase n=1 Tax=Penicillium brasilianum TaxID=104259 RepID=A0A1S9RD03_PENBI|nr:Scytalone dehydratase [Penicillium brasilianum]